MTIAKTGVSVDTVRAPRDSKSEVVRKPAEDRLDPAELRTELGNKRKLLNILESRGIQVAQADAIREQIETALKDLDSIIAEES